MSLAVDQTGRHNILIKNEGRKDSTVFFGPLSDSDCKRLLGMKNTKKGTEDDSKSVVEAASQIVATTNKRLQDTLKELDVIRQLLEKERKAHRETKKKL